MSKSRLFIGSSTEGLAIAYGIQENLTHTAETTIWNQGVFHLSESSLESLITILESSDFGVFVFSPDDYIKIRGKKDLSIRDNVLFELGLFIGKLGRKRSFIVIPDNIEFHLPTDLIGVTPAKYETNRSDKNMSAATGNAAHKIREEIVKQGPFRIANDIPEITTEKEVLSSKKKQDWFDYLYIEKNYDKAIILLKKQIRYTKDTDEKIQFKGRMCFAEYKKDSQNGIKEYEKLISENNSNNLSYLAYIETLYSINSFKKALEIAELGIQNCPRKIFLSNQKARCLWALNKKDEALSFLTTSISSLDDSDGILIKSLADYYIELKDNKNALQLLHKAYFSHPNKEDIMYKFAIVAYDMNQKEVCVLLYKELLKLDSTDPDYWGLLGNAYLDLELYNPSLTAYEKAIELSKHKQAWLYGNIGNLYNNKNLYNKAEINLKISLSVNEKSEYAHNRLSTVYTSLQVEEKKINEILALAKTKINSETIE